MTQSNEMSTTSCDLCGGTQFEALSQHDRHGKDLETVVCTGCGLVMHMPVPSEQEVEDYYANAYRQDYHGESVPNVRRVMRAWKNGERIYKRISPFLNKQDRCMEVGAGLGCTVKVFDTHGYQAFGIEPNKDFNSYSREQLHANVENTNLYTLEEKPIADVIFLIHVIEHFSSPRRALTKMAQLLEDGGRLYMECPNLIGPFSTFGRMFHYAHIYNFTPQTLIAIAAQCGFEVEQVFTTQDEPNIEILFRKISAQDTVAQNTAVQNATATLAEHAALVKKEVGHYNWFTYHLRMGYWVLRVKKLWSYLVEMLCAKGFVQKLLEKLAQA